MAIPFHTTHRRLNSGPIGVLLVGCGGNGSAMLLKLATLDRTLRMLGHPGLDVLACDGDLVSAPNLARQPYLPSEVGRSKAVSLVTRINMTYGLNWQAEHRFIGPRSTPGPRHRADVVITCVDSRGARADVHEAMKEYRPCYTLDLGNDRTTGQFALGTVGRGHSVELPTAAEMWPEIADRSAALGDDDGPSCSSEEAVRRQDLFIHEALSAHASNLVWRLLRDGRIEHHGGFVNLVTGVAAPIPVPAPPEPARAAA